MPGNEVKLSPTSVQPISPGTPEAAQSRLICFGLIWFFSKSGESGVNSPQRKVLTLLNPFTTKEISKWTTKVTA